MHRTEPLLKTATPERLLLRDPAQPPCKCPTLSPSQKTLALGHVVAHDLLMGAEKIGLI